jgi:hypothetical protein
MNLTRTKNHAQELLPADTQQLPFIQGVLYILRLSIIEVCRGVTEVEGVRVQSLGTGK